MSRNPAPSRAQVRQREVAWLLRIVDGLRANLVASRSRAKALSRADQAWIDNLYAELSRKRHHLAATHPTKSDRIWRKR